MTFEEFLDARNLWNDALQKSLDNHIFLTWEWLTSWWRFYGDKRRFLLVTVGSDQEIYAAAPLMSSNYKLYGLGLRKIEFIATPASDYHNFLLKENRRDHVRMMIQYASKTDPEWDCFELKEIPENSETARILKTVSDKPLGLETRIQTSCPCVFLPNAFEEYLLSLGSSWRRNIRRWERRLKLNHKVCFEVCSDLEEVNEAMKIVFDLHQKRWRLRKQPGAFADPKFCDFHLDVARSFFERGWLNLNLLTLDDEPVAAGYAFKYAQKLFCYLSGFDPQYSEYEVGNLRHVYLIKYCIENGLKEYDFLRGRESYKSQWNSVMRKNLEVKAIKRKIIPIIYDWIARNNRFSALTYKLGERLSLQ